ncbi:Mitochondrial beta-keto-acyl synthase [Agyrium rufum]|nr:Mitochondrial beta-keto-acyl synthase [Agyrium rufum]
MRKVVVTGLGAVTPLGLGVRRLWKRVLDGECGITSLKGRGSEFEKLQCQVAGLVPEGPVKDGRWTASEHFSKNDLRRMAKHMQFAMVATREALVDAQWSLISPGEQDRTGICLGTGIGSFEDIVETTKVFATSGARKVSPHFVPRTLNNLGAGYISIAFGLRGPNHNVSTACTTGAHAISDAARMIATDEADVMVAGGSESCITPLAIVGFERSRSLTTSWNDEPSKASRPFSSDRDGFVMGEGAGVLLLEEYEHALKRKAPIYAILASHAATSDAHHATTPPPSGEGALRSMRLALTRAELAPEQLSYINAHGTSTPLGDLAENTAIMGLFGSTRPADVKTLISSTKGATGHMLGAAGAIEAIFAVLAVRDNIVPPTLNLRDWDKTQFPLDYVPLRARSGLVETALTNSFGFGGTNATLCFKKCLGNSSSNHQPTITRTGA